jgi:hypothetical protein
VHMRRRRHAAAATAVAGETGDGSCSEEGDSGDADAVGSDERPCYVS